MFVFTHPLDALPDRQRPVRSRRWLALAVALAAALAAAACSTTPSQPESASEQTRCVTGFDPGTDYYPDKIELTYAQEFSVEYHDSYAVLHVTEPFPGGAPEQYVLHRCGTPVPELSGDLADAPVVETPVTSLFSESTTHLAMIDELGQSGVVTGVANGGNVNTEAVRAGLDDGSVIEFSPNQSIDTELVIASHPGVYVTQGTEDPAHQNLRNAGVPVVADVEWLEQSALGRAEWIKMFGALTGEEQRATEAFEKIEADYNDVKKRAEGTETTTVLPGQMYEGTWSMPAGESYVASMLADANGTYAWADTTGTGSLQLDLEEVLAKAGDAPVWLRSDTVETLADVIADDPRYEQFAAFKDGNVWSNNLHVNDQGGNDFWERGVARPDLVLGDLTAILHPEAMPDHEFAFYRKLDG